MNPSSQMLGDAEPAEMPDASWTRLYGDAESTGYTPDFGPVNLVKNGTAWTNPNGVGTPLFHEGRYIGYATIDGKTVLASLDPVDGSCAWSLQVKQWYCTPCISGGRLYFIDSDIFDYSDPAGELICLDASTGEVIWITGSGKIYTGSPVVAEDKVFAVTMGDTITAWNLSDGRSVWAATLSPSSSMHVSPAYHDGVVYTGNAAFDADDGSVVWLRTNGIISSVAYSQGRLYGNDRYGAFFCIDADNGATVWKYDGDASSWNAIISKPCVVNGYAIFADQEGDVYCFHSSNGTLIWTLHESASIIASPVASGNGIVYVISRSLAAVLPWNGTVVSRYYWNSHGWSEVSTPGIEDGQLLMPGLCGSFRINPDGDADGDGFLDGEDAFPFDPSSSQDSDGDWRPDASDAFPADPLEWADADGDGLGNNRETDDDDDGVLDAEDAFPLDARYSFDNDGDGVADELDDDDDDDGTPDADDDFPLDSSEWLDTDGDGHGDNSDVFPTLPGEWLDSDIDGVGNNADEFPHNPYEWADEDGDGIGDNGDEYPSDPYNGQLPEIILKFTLIASFIIISLGWIILMIVITSRR